ncbi:MAG: hypothetical protein FIB04_11240 [Gammaproteobacteria bacterium]|nr:hypothetical protein [Gammaproteobacteria bacterium]
MLLDRARSACALAAVGLLTVGAPAVSHAEGAADDWKYTATIYGWLPTLDGTFNFPGSSGGSAVSVDASKILDALNFTFMGMLQAEKGRWGLATDVIYLDLGGSKKDVKDFSLGPNGLPAGVTAAADLGIRGWLWTLDGTYLAVDNPDHPVMVFAGARMLDLTADLDWELQGNVAGLPIGERKGQREGGDTLWDGIVGAKGRVNFGEDKKWFVPYYVDVGTGNSDLTWQWFAGLGYGFEWGDVVAVWRYLDYKLNSGDPIEDLYLEGAAVGVTFRF